MAFIPESSVLNTVNELKNLSHLITYVAPLGATGVGGGGEMYPVTITTAQPNSTITVNNNTITGYYSDAFVNEIHYRTVDDRFVVVPKWQDIVYAIAAGSLSEIYYYKADMTTRIVYTYTATANGQSKDYIINVDNDWQFGRNRLIKYTNLTRYQQKILVEWINNNAGKVIWLDNIVQAIDWENNSL
jgi:hypothetical protein